MRTEKPPIQWWTKEQARANVERTRKELHECYVEPTATFLEAHVLAPASVERLRRALAEYDSTVEEKDRC
jgi:hypothetical protein